MKKDEEVTEQQELQRERLPNSGLPEFADIATVFILILDLKGRIQYINPWFEAKTGYRAEEVKGKDWFDTFLPDFDKSRINEIFEKTTGGYDTSGTVNPIMTKSGEEIDIVWFNNLLLDESGQPDRMMCIGHAVSAHQELNRLMSLQREQFRNLLENLRYGVCENDLSGTITYCNRRAAEILGTEREELVGKKIWDFTPEQGRADIMDYFQKVLTERPEPSTYNSTVLHSSRGEIPVSIDWNYNLGSNGELMGFTAVINSKETHKNIENNLRAQEIFLERFFLQSLDGCFFMMMDKPVSWNEDVNKKETLDYIFSHQRVTRVNDEMLKQYRLSKSEFIGLKPEDFFASDLDYGKQLWREMLDEGRLSTRSREHKSDGTEMWIEGEYVCLYNSDGEFIGHFGIQREITVRKRLEDELEEKKNNLKEAQKIARIGSWALDLEKDQLTWSDEIFNLFELDKDVFKPGYKEFLDAIHPEDREAVDSAYTNSLRTRKPYQIEHRLLMKDGRIKWVEERCTTEFDDSGKALVSRGTVQDITERHQLEESLLFLNEELKKHLAEETAELEEQSRFNEIILQTSKNGFYIVDTSKRYRRVNQAYCNLLGYSEAELLNLTLLDTEAIETLEEMDIHGEEIRKKGSEVFETLQRRKDGSLVEIEISTSRVELNGEELFYGFVRDISEKKRSERELKQALTEAEQANNAKNEFLSRMSHELRTPMNAILGFTQVLQLENLLPEQMESVDEVYRAGEHLLTLINELLDLSSIEIGRINIRQQPVQLGDVLLEAKKLNERLFAERNISYINNCKNENWVIADPVRLRQVLVNLLSNAAKYNRQGGSIILNCKSQGKDHLCIQVTDTGPGIPAEQLSDLFKPFERLGAEKSQIQGTGIGLSLSKRLVELMGGEIGVESKVDHGSTFWIKLLRGALSFTDGEDYPYPAGEETRSEQNGRVLYIEDNAANLRLLESFCRHYPGISLIPATNGLAGLELAKQSCPDLILLDIHLPDISGYEVLSRLKEDAVCREIPVVAVSADAMPEDLSKGLDAGFSRYLTKPVNIKEVEQVLAEFLDLRLSE